MTAGRPWARPVLAMIWCGVLLLAPAPRVDSQDTGPHLVDSSPVVPFADRLLEHSAGELGGIEVAATLVSGSEVEDPEGRIEVALEAVVRMDPRWASDELLKVTLLAYDLDEEPLILEEEVRLGEPGGATWWIYRRQVLLPEDFLEAVLIVEDPAAGRRGGTRVAYGAPLAPELPAAPAPSVGTGVLLDQKARVVGSSQRAQGRRPLRLVPPPGRAHSGSIRVRTVLTVDDVRQVVFLLDGEEVSRDEDEPFTLTIDVGAEVAPREIVAVAYSGGGLELGRDVLLLNSAAELFDLRLALDDTGASGEEIVLRAAVSVPRQETLDRVEFYRNDVLVETLETEPFETRVQRAGLGPQDYLRAVAYLADGTSLDDVRLLSEANSGERIEVNLVQVFAVASRKDGEPITDLTIEDFEVRVGRRKVEIERFERAEEVPLSLGLIFDTSGSMFALMPDAKQAGARFLASIVGDSDRAFLVDFDTRPRLAHPLTGDLGSLLRRFGQLEAKGRTALYDAVVFGSLQFDEAPGRRALVVLTDGVPSGGRFGARDCIKLATENAIPIYSIDLSGVLSAHSAAKLPLVALAKSTGGQVHTIPGDPTGMGDYEGVSRALDEAYAQIERELRSQYIMAFSTAKPLTADEIKSIKVEVNRPGAKVRRVVGATRG